MPKKPAVPDAVKQRGSATAAGSERIGGGVRHAPPILRRDPVPRGETGTPG